MQWAAVSTNRSAINVPVQSTLGGGPSQLVRRVTKATTACSSANLP
jgi:hypothetical protein